MITLKLILHHSQHSEDDDGDGGGGEGDANMLGKHKHMSEHGIGTTQREERMQ
jgi:hypothetical protein